MKGLASWRDRILGADREVPVLGGALVPYVNLDNAASTPALREVVEVVHHFLPYYSGVHRGTGFKSRLSTMAYDVAHETVARFVNASTDTNTVIFTKNTTEAINKLASCFPLRPGSVIVSTLMEHHSNDLPWRGRAEIVRAGVTRRGRLDEADVDRLLDRYGERVALLVVSGASNVTGFVQPIHRLARKAHAVGARILVDAAQLAPHRRIDVRPDADPEHLDFVVLSAHKMYAPFGTGALVGARDVFLDRPPVQSGGGTVDIVTDEDVYWAELPHREEAGSPNVVGAVAMAAAATVLMDGDMEGVAIHERVLTSYALDQLREIPGLSLYGEAHLCEQDDRVGVIPFNIDGCHHALVAAILAYEGAIGVRNGCFCAQPYVVRLLGLTPAEQAARRRDFLAGDRSLTPGMVRVSLGLYNTTDDVDRLVEMLWRIARHRYEGTYVSTPASGECVPAGCLDAFTTHFAIA